MKYEVRKYRPLKPNPNPNHKSPPSITVSMMHSLPSTTAQMQIHLPLPPPSTMLPYSTHLCPRVTKKHLILTLTLIVTYEH